MSGLEPQPADPGRFVWPPRKATPPSAAPAAAPRCSRRSAESDARSSPWLSFEREFLGLEAAPLRTRAAEAQWLPDTSDDYCARCGRTRTTIAAAAEGCAECEGIRFAWDRLVRVGEFTGVLRRWIHEVKFTRWRRLGVDLGEILGESLAALSNSGASGPTVLVPVPDATLRRLWRGIDHTSVIAHGVAGVTGWPIVQPLCRRLGRSQLAVAPSERAANVSRSFAARREAARELIGVARIVVLDDVITTGATMRACCRLAAAAARGGGSAGERPEVWAACLARTPPPRQRGPA